MLRPEEGGDDEPDEIVGRKEPDGDGCSDDYAEGRQDRDWLIL